jgi:restriction system protein
MAEIPDYQSMMLPLLRRSAESEINNKAGVEAVASHYSLTTEHLSELLPSGLQTKVSNRVAWALIYMTRAGLLDRIRRGIYCITDRGRQTLKNNPTNIDNKILKQFPEFLAFTNATNAGDAGGDAQQRWMAKAHQPQPP